MGVQRSHAMQCLVQSNNFTRNENGYNSKEHYCKKTGSQSGSQTGSEKSGSQTGS
ncbi:MAG: hypothetical protein FD134_2422, partial [Gallionellaceae bacterium]